LKCGRCRLLCAKKQWAKIGTCLSGEDRELAQQRNENAMGNTDSQIAGESLRLYCTSRLCQLRQLKNQQ